MNQEDVFILVRLSESDNLFALLGWEQDCSSRLHRWGLSEVCDRQ